MQARANENVTATDRSESTDLINYFMVDES